jgi:hypothetical protein
LELDEAHQVEQFEAWLSEQGISITGQYATGSGDSVRYRLRLLDGMEIEVGFNVTTLAERPQEAIEAVRAAIEEQRGGANGNGRHN